MGVKEQTGLLLLKHKNKFAFRLFKRELILFGLRGTDEYFSQGVKIKSLL